MNLRTSIRSAGRSAGSSINLQKVSFNFATIDFPGAASTFPVRLNNQGQIIGWQRDANGIAHSLLADTHSFSTFDPPSLASQEGSFATGINKKGEIVGAVAKNGINPQSQAYIKRGNSFSLYNHPNADLSKGTEFSGINDAGVRVGGYTDSANTEHGIIQDDNTTTLLEANPSIPANAGTWVFDINNLGQMVGIYFDPASDVQHGFFIDGTTFVTVDFPGSNVTSLNGINDLGQMAGAYFDQKNKLFRAFLTDGTIFITIDYPNLPQGFGTFVSGIDNSGRIVGYYGAQVGIESSGDRAAVHGFFAMPVVETNSAVQPLRTVRVAQISGSNTDPDPKHPIHDPEGWQLLNDTTKWGAVGFDEGANAEHNCKLYFFSGDVVRRNSNQDPLNNSHLVAETEDPKVIWTADPTNLARGFGLQAVLQNGEFWPFEAEAPVGVTLSLEPAVSAFSSAGRVYVFVGLGTAYWSGQTRPGDPAEGLYLVSTDQPDQAQVYRTEFLFDPRIGVCPADGGNHTVLGFNFVLPHDVSKDPQDGFDWFRCGKCACLFASVNESRTGGVCQAGGTHEADAPNGFHYTIPHDRPEDPLNQGKWRRCGKCQTMFFIGSSPSQGICPADRLPHEAEAADQTDFVLPHDQPEDPKHVANWRRCRLCSCLYWKGLWMKGTCVAVAADPKNPDSPRDHDAVDNGDLFKFLENELILTHDVPEDSHHQANWHFCTKCFGLFNASDKNVCPTDSTPHKIDDKDNNGKPSLPRSPPDGRIRIEPPVGINFVIPHDLAEDASHQAGWHRCTKCGLLYSDLSFFFENWTALSSAGPAAGDPATMVTDGQQHVFYRGTDGAINHIFWTPGTTVPVPQDWTALAGAGPAGLAAGDPATMVTDGQQHVFYRGTDAHIKHIFWTPGTTVPVPQDWTDLAGAGPAGLAAGDPATRVTDGQQHVFYRGTDAAIKHIFWNAADNSFHFQDWTALAGAGPADLAAGDPATMVTADQQHVFYRGTDGATKHIFWNAANKCPAGHSHLPSGERFVLPRRIPEDHHNERDWRFCTKCFGLARAPTNAFRPFWTLDSAVVHNADVSGLPSQTGDGLVILGYEPGAKVFHLAWMPLGPSGPRLQDVQYYSGQPGAPSWRENVEEAAELFGSNLSDWNRISLAWLEGPRRWILLHGGDDAESLALARPSGTGRMRSKSFPATPRRAATSTLRIGQTPGATHTDLPSSRDSPNGIPPRAYWASIC